MLKCVECGSKAEQWHHVTPRSEGGVLVVPICRRCHVAHHSLAGDFIRWGRMGGQVTAADPEHWKANLVQFKAAAERSAAARRGWVTRRARAEVLASEQPFSSCNPVANSEPRASANAHVPAGSTALPAPPSRPSRIDLGSGKSLRACVRVYARVRLRTRRCAVTFMDILAGLADYWWVGAVLVFALVLGRMFAERALLGLDRTELRDAIEKLEKSIGAQDESVLSGDWTLGNAGWYYQDPPKRKRLVLGDDGEVLDMEDEKPKRKELHI